MRSKRLTVGQKKEIFRSLVETQDQGEMTFDMGSLEVADQIVVVPDNYPSKGTGERGAFFFDSEGNLLGLAQATR